jgi:hypothetical protein
VFKIDQYLGHLNKASLSNLKLEKERNIAVEGVLETAGCSSFFFTFANSIYSPIKGQNYTAKSRA